MQNINQKIPIVEGENKINKYRDINNYQNIDRIKEIEDENLKEEKKPKQKVERCHFCNKKLKMIYFNCKCNGIFCNKHRYSHTHNCTYQGKKKEEIKNTLEKENPKIESKRCIKIN
tara:strand:- start:13695 stop:14042 length:348 start_codon:yes stop_codon:yes gene_type:complete